MTWVVPVELEDALYAAAREVIGEAPLAPGLLARAVIDRSRRYTSERERLARPADRTADLAARAAFFTIADAIKIALPLRELAGRAAIPARRPLRLVDLGAGCGAMSLGAIATLPELADAEITAIDHDLDALRIAGAALRGLATARGFVVDVTTRVADVAATALPPADLVAIGSVLNELPADARLPLLERALAAIGDDGAVIVIEPALRDTARALHELRDAVIAGGRGHVFAPCTRAAAPCPALADPDDWCHEDRALALPRRTAELARLTHLRDSGMKFAYLVLRRQPLALVDAAPAWRVVSAAMPAKGKLEVIGCSAAGRVPLRLLRRHRSADNRGFEAAERGDVVVIEGAEPDGARVEITGDTRVARLEPAVRPR